MGGRRLFDWRLAATGLVVCLAAWERAERRRLSRRQGVATAPAPVLVPEQAPARIEKPRRARVRARRLATSLVFATLFFAGAALTAVAGNETAQGGDTVATATTGDPTATATTGVDPGSTDAAAATETTTEAAPPTTDASSTTAAAAATPAPPAEPASTGPAPAAPAPAAPAPAAPAAPATTDVTPADPAPAAAAPADPAPAAPAPAAPAPAPAAPAPVVTTTATTTAVVTAPAAPPAAHTQVAAPVHHAAPPRRTVSRLGAPLPLPAGVAPVFYPTVPFDLQAWEHDNTSAPLGAAAVAIAMHYLGTPYVWGGASPASGFDCSGLTMFVYAQLGIALPHYAASQFAAFPKLDPSQLEPGDLVFFEPRADGPGHVAIYAGNDTIVEAPHTGALVRIGSLSGSAAAMGFLGAVRPYGTAAGARLLLSFAGPVAAPPAERRSVSATGVRPL